MSDSFPSPAYSDLPLAAWKKERDVSLPWLAERLRELGENEQFSLTHVPLQSSSHWALRDGAIRHVSDRFFSVIGIKAEPPDGTDIEQPLLDQREIGILAIFVRKRTAEPEVLVQFKAEPGNVGLFQLAPSYQATASNTDRVHGGAGPLLGEWLQKGSTSITDTLQSEQGSRFFGKRNRNACLLMREHDEPTTRFHAWMPVRELCALLSENHLLNTDLRSTLLCADWTLLGGGHPFGGTGFAELLRASFELADHQSMETLAEVREDLEQAFNWRSAPKIVPLDELTGWTFEEEGPAPQGGSGRPFRIRHIRVHSASREVPAWDQPIVQSGGVGKVVLPMGLNRGVPHFLFKKVTEPGFGTRAELTTAILIEPGAPENLNLFEKALLTGAHKLASCRQSEEGGRFLFDENEYTIADVGEAARPPAGYHWLSLAQTYALIRQGLTFTNEARSALSLLLRWL